MMELLKIDLYKLNKSPVLKVIMAVMVIISFATAMSTLSHLNSPETLKNLDLPVYGKDAFFVMLKDYPTITIVGMIIICIIVCGDFDHKIIQSLIQAGYKRKDIVSSKILSIVFTYTIVYFPLLFVRTIVQTVVCGFGEHFGLGILFNMFFAYISIILVSTAINGIVIFLSFVVKNSIVVFTLGFVIIELFVNVIKSFTMSNSSLGQYIKFLPVGNLQYLYEQNYSFKSLALVVIISVFFIVVWRLLTVIAFKKIDLR